MLYYYLHDHLCSNFRSPNTINKYFPLPQVKPQSVFPNIILNTRNSNSNSNGNSNSNHRGNQVAASGGELNLFCLKILTTFGGKCLRNGSKNGPMAQRTDRNQVAASGGELKRLWEEVLGWSIYSTDTRLVHLFDQFVPGDALQ